MHESAHWMLETMGDLVDMVQSSELQLDEGQQRAVDDYHRLLKWLGTDVTEWNTLTHEEKRPLHEKMATAFETYLLEGRAPSKELRGAFKFLRT